MNITLRQLRYFLALARHGHFTRAAEISHVSQPALSMQIRALEDAAGARLVERTPSGVVLTPQGRALERDARRVMAAMAGLEQGLRRPGQGGRLMLGMIPTVAPYLLPQALPVLRARDIGRDLHLREARTERLLDELIAGRLDAAVVATPPRNDDLESAPLFVDRFLLAGSAARIARLRDDPPEPRDLDPGQLLLLDEGHCLGDQALEVCGLERGSARLDLGAASLATLCRLAAQGMGLTFLPEIAAAQEIAAAPGLTAIRFPAPQPAREVVLLRRASTPSQGWFEDLAAILADAGAALLGPDDMAVMTPAGSARR
ncbi:MAG: hydrogen peroxide-inducible genes activator [Paracoccus sp. (in: a-proteobacteria)]|uniref:hydrogen peroxide-inducible genes activator n=1 Tax=Paracoccus sp. TaxID=267 RepID=UPI000C69E177|nr:hydrogen peroxide-inducible genes activator [Paracoccus sp. (in: a-proteobacteria)]MAN56427.1 LysR family transcriptional regulator [Paracoccus sp. (in: a-proteobacteria)]MBA48892.1 LysR family transcriptional regulator [Paracoccus sp. (in: a-proteobacteria)]|tara:strand:+ start:7901 stop:8848 length:948 start_codon:yes stop_codon:yes gene_type:complete